MLLGTIKLYIFSIDMQHDYYYTSTIHILSSDCLKTIKKKKMENKCIKRFICFAQHAALDMIKIHIRWAQQRGQWLRHSRTFLSFEVCPALDVGDLMRYETAFTMAVNVKEQTDEWPDICVIQGKVIKRRLTFQKKEQENRKSLWGKWTE